MKKEIKASLILISMSFLEIQSCVTYNVKRLGEMKENERNLEKLIERQTEESYNLHSDTNKKEE